MSSYISNLGMTKCGRALTYDITDNKGVVAMSSNILRAGFLVRGEIDDTGSLLFPSFPGKVF